MFHSGDAACSKKKQLTIFCETIKNCMCTDHQMIEPYMFQDMPVSDKGVF